MFVVSKNAADGTVTLGSNQSLMTKHIRLKNVNLLAVDSLDAPIRVSVKLRSTHKGAPATIQAIDGHTHLLTFDEEQRAAAPGQSAVFYDDSGRIICGGIIA